MTQAESDLWLVERHSGRNGDIYRTKFFGDETGARAKFAKIKEGLRQGEVRLRHPTGYIVDSAWAVRARTALQRRPPCSGNALEAATSAIANAKACAHVPPCSYCDSSDGCGTLAAAALEAALPLWVLTQ